MQRQLRRQCIPRWSTVACQCVLRQRLPCAQLPRMLAVSCILDTCIGFSPLFLQLQVMLATAYCLLLTTGQRKEDTLPQVLIFGYMCTVDRKLGGPIEIYRRELDYFYMYTDCYFQSYDPRNYITLALCPCVGKKINTMMIVVCMCV